MAKLGNHDAMPARLAAAVADPEHMRMFVGLIVEADEYAAVHSMLVTGTQRMHRAVARAVAREFARATTMAAANRTHSTIEQEDSVTWLQQPLRHSGSRAYNHDTPLREADRAAMFAVARDIQMLWSPMRLSAGVRPRAHSRRRSS